VKIMVVWTDAPGHGLGGNTPAWNNDLDLVVEDGGTTYRGNNFGGSGFSMAGGVADDRNNTEGVFIGPTAPGSYTIRVQASDINSDAIPGVGDGTDQDFAVVCYNCAEEPGFTLAAAPSTSEVCAPNDAEFNVGVGSILGFSNPVTLSASGQPAGTTVTFVPNPVTPGNASTMTVSNTGAAAGGTYPITIQGEDPISMEMKTRNVTLKLFTGLPTAPGLLSPADGALDVSIAPELSWSASADASSYTVDIARDAAFADIVYSAITGATTESVGSALDTATEHFWRVTPSNACGSGGSSSTFSFTTADFPPVLLVDDDDNNPNVQNTYVNALNNLGVDYDLWNTMNSDNEPDAQTLGLYKLVIWFTGDEFGGAAGPGAAGEAALATYLDGGGCLFITAQDYPYDRGNTPFMMNYLGLASYNNDVGHTTATGTGSIFSGFGPFTLSYPFSNFSDRLNPSAGGELAFSGSAGNAAISRDNGVYRTVYFGFPWEAISGAANREAVLSAILDPCTFVTANVVASRSCADHGGTSYCTALSDGDIEPRTSGATRLEFDLDGPVSSVSAVVVCDANPYGGTATVNAPGGSSISVEFNPALPDQDCCEVALSGDAAGSIVISTLAGDVDRNGNVNTADITVVKPKLGQMVGASNYFYDVDANGAINTADITAVKPLLGHAGAVCP
jgi:hypothetical protein